MAHGTSQDILVNSKPPGAEVFLEGKFIGKTPMKINLKRSSTHEITLRYGEQERVVVIKSRTDTGSIILDATPLVIAGGLPLPLALALIAKSKGLLLLVLQLFVE